MTTRGKAITNYCRSCIHDPAAFGTWREQVAACPAVACPLWRFRPLQDRALCPSWIHNRDPADLPENWATTAQPDAVRAMRKATADMVCARAVERGGEASPARIEALPGGGAV